MLQLLRLYNKEHVIALIPLGGGELIQENTEVEMRELMRLGQLSFLIDSERTSASAPPSTRHEAFRQLCAKLGVPGHMLERRALENYLTEQAVQAAFGPSKHALGPYDKPGTEGWSKNQNWKAAAEMSRADLSGTDLDGFLDNL